MIDAAPTIVELSAAEQQRRRRIDALPVRFVLRLQQTVGNRAVTRLLVPRPTSTALAVVPQPPGAVSVPSGRFVRWASFWRGLWKRPAARVSTETAAREIVRNSPGYP